MNSSSQIPADGPDAVLGRLVATLRLPHDRAQVARSLAAHPRPTSLLALVDVGRQLGLELTPVRSNLEALRAQPAPVIVHFDRDGVGGFGVLERFSEDRLEVWDSENGLHPLDRDLFLETWSGVAVLMKSSSTGAPRSWGARLPALLFGGDPPSIVGPSSKDLRIALVVLFLLVLSLAVWTYPVGARVPTLALACLCLAGVVITASMTMAISDYAGPFSPGICRRGRLIDCQSVLTSRFARVFGIPLSDLGIAFYLAMLLLLVSGAGRPAASGVAAFIFVATVPVAIALTALQLWMRRLCAMCLAVHAVNLGGAAVAWLYLPRNLVGPEVWHMASLFALFLCVALFVVIPYLKEAKGVARLMIERARMSASPLASAAQLVTEPDTGLEAAACAVELGGSAAPDQLVAFVHPTCKQCAPVIRELRALAAGGRVNAFLTIPPRGPAEQRLCEVLIGIGLRAGAEEMLRAFDIAKHRLDDLLHDDPSKLLQSELGLPQEAMEPAADAVAIVERTESFAEDHVEGTPALFFNGIPYRGPVSHLIELLAQHPDLLVATRREAPQDA